MLTCVLFGNSASYTLAVSTCSYYIIYSLTLLLLRFPLDHRQTRLLLPEPLAVNRGERLTGSIHFKVNDARSYDLTLDLEVDRPGGGAEWDRNPLKRRATYALQQQCFK